MKLFITIHSAFFFLLLISDTLATRSKTQVTFDIRNENLGNFKGGRLGGIEPNLQWKTKGATNDFYWETGLDLQITGVLELPYMTTRGKLTRKAPLPGGFMMSTCGEIISSSPNIMNVDIFAARIDNKGEGATSIQVLGTKDLLAGYWTNGFISNVRLVAKKSILLRGKMTFQARYNVKKRRFDYQIDQTSTMRHVCWNSSQNKLSLTQSFDDFHQMIIPSITTSGEWDISYKRCIPQIDDATLTASYKPKNWFRWQWEDEAWVASLTTPLQKGQKIGIDFQLKRKITL